MTDHWTHPVATWLDPDTGNLLDHPQLMQEVSQSNVLLLGETHDRYDIHRWQLHICAAMRAYRNEIAVGFEMFPRRVQPVLDDWVAGKLNQNTFLETVEWSKVWGFAPELYLPLFHFCREFGVPMLALNCYRELVTRVGKEGWDAIPADERDGLTPSAAATPAYRQYLFDITGGGSPSRKVQSADAPEFDRFVRAQQTWDRAFACNIANALEVENPPLVIGIIGRGHLEYGHGTPFQLQHLGIDKVITLLPSDEPPPINQDIMGIARAIFRLQPDQS
ncbi:ChaN family lipoprotein [Mesorhizobium sp. SB112]|uniref:ChaN family lipoprotein n=1 Tax=Mesorhizobium sp. SB112 TaxID=3151853 RepID=UPI0032644958